MNHSKEKYLQYSFLLCCLLWLTLNFVTANISGIFSDEFIYFHSGHLHAKLMDFILYKPILFFGHSPLVSFIHWILSPLGMYGLRFFHVLGLWLVLTTFKPKNFWQYFCCLFIVLHPTFLTHSTLIYPEIYQAFLGIIIWQLFNSERSKLCGLFFLIAVLWRESSLAFFFALCPFLVTRKSLRVFTPFVPGLITLALHLGYVSYTESWNPGRVEAARDLMSFSGNFNHLNQVGAFLLGIGLFYPLILWPAFSLLKRNQLFRTLQSHKAEIVYLVFFLVIFSALIIYRPVNDSWSLFHRMRSLGILGFILVLGLSFFSAPIKWKRELIFAFVSALSFYTFFFFYRDLSSRDLIPAILILIYALSKLKPNKTLIILAIISFNMILSQHYAGVNDSDFLKGSKAGLNAIQRDYYLSYFNETLSNLNTLEVKLDDGVAAVAKEQFFVDTPITESSKNSSKLLSFDHGDSHQVLKQNVAFTLYFIK